MHDVASWSFVAAIVAVVISAWWTCQSLTSIKRQIYMPGRTSRRNLCHPSIHCGQFRIFAASRPQGLRAIIHACGQRPPSAWSVIGHHCCTDTAITCIQMIWFIKDRGTNRPSPLWYLVENTTNHKSLWLVYPTERNGDKGSEILFSVK